jgi:hypothetical protein
MGHACAVAGADILGTRFGVFNLTAAQSLRHLQIAMGRKRRSYVSGEILGTIGIFI